MKREEKKRIFFLCFIEEVLKTTEYRIISNTYKCTMYRFYLMIYAEKHQTKALNVATIK